MYYKRKNTIVSMLVLVLTQGLLGVNTKLAKQQKLRSQTIKTILDEQPYIEEPSVLTRMSPEITLDLIPRLPALPTEVVNIIKAHIALQDEDFLHKDDLHDEVSSAILKDYIPLHRSVLNSLKACYSIEELLEYVKGYRKSLKCITENGDNIWLTLSDCNLITLPECIGNLSKLKWLDLNDNQLATLPEYLDNLSNLKTLRLNNNQLTTLPKCICNLSSLCKLHLNNNQLTTLPESIGNLSNLWSLYLNNNQLTTLPEYIGNLSSLKGLHLNNNQLTTLPECIGNLSNLEWLELSNNQLTALPECIGSLSDLVRLELNNNQLATLPERIGNLSNLRELYLNNNQLTTLPECISNLFKLEWLELNDNQLATLPECIGNLSKLRRLELNDNQLTTLPESIDSLSNLEWLYLNNNSFEHKSITPETLPISSLHYLFIEKEKLAQELLDIFASIDSDKVLLSATELFEELRGKNKKLLITPDDIRRIVKPEDWYRFGISEIVTSEK